MKSNTRTVLSTTLTSATSYSSGPLDVGDVYDLAVDCDLTQLTQAATMTISRIGADNVLYPIDTTTMNATGKYSRSIGVGLSSNSSFGDQIQLDISPSAGTVGATVSIKGKG